MNDKQIAEIGFWQGLTQDLNRFRLIRIADLKEKTKFFPTLFEETGRGLDLGCGPESIFEYCEALQYKFEAVDPLMDEYAKLFPLRHYTNKHSQQDGENLTFYDEAFDWVFCVNVIDHTPDPQKMIDEVYRVLKPGGRFYFEVNFDDHITPCHYGLWTQETVENHIKSDKFTLISSNIERNPDYPQSLYHAVYQKI